MSKVKKLDDPTEFDKIKTGLKTNQSLKKHEAERYSVWYNHFHLLNQLVGENKSQIGWVGTHWKTILKYINDTYTPPSATPSTLRNHLEGLANVLLAINKNKYKEIVRPFYNTGLSIQQVIDKERENSVLDEKDVANFVPYEDLMKERERLYDLWMKDPKNLKLNMFHLILAINTLIPPLRLNFIDMQIYPERLTNGKVNKKIPKNSPEPPDNETNYLWEKTPGHWSIVINYDKIENKRRAKNIERQIINLDDEIQGVTDGHKLNEIINQSLIDAPRNFVLIGIKTKQPMPVSSYDSALREMFKPKKPRQNLLRKAYINYWHDTRLKLSESKLKAIAFRMRHTVEVARGSYKKINATDFPEEIESSGLLEQLKIPKPVKLPILPKEKEHVHFNPKEYAKEYRQSHAEEISAKRKEQYEKNKYEILKNKQLWYLNHSLVVQPTSKSILEYKLRQDTNGKWYSEN